MATNKTRARTGRAADEEVVDAASHDSSAGAPPLRTLRSGSYPWQAERPLAWPVTSEVGPGLEGVIACETAVSWLDPSAGLLMYRGVPIERLAGAASFEEVAFLLISGGRPERAPVRFAAFADRLRSSRALPSQVVALLRGLDPAVHPTRLLRAGVSALGCHELRVGDELSGEQHWRELRIVGQVAALVAEVGRHRAGLPPRRQRPGRAQLGLAAGLLRALSDADPDPQDVALLDLLWVLYADHGMDAPTFTSMIVASCLADPYYNVVAGLSALMGPRLGGATERVLGQLLPLVPAGEGPARAWVRQTLAAGGRVAGFGHRMYQMADPRAVVLRRELALASRRRGRPELFGVARAVEEEASRLLAPRGVHVNINFYAAPLFHLLGVEAALVPCLYAVGRMAGLVARVHEALVAGRLYRPVTRYVGEVAR